MSYCPFNFSSHQRVQHMTSQSLLILIDFDSFFMGLGPIEAFSVIRMCRCLLETESVVSEDTLMRFVLETSIIRRKVSFSLICSV